jgi:hypothetical protein
MDEIDLEDVNDSSTDDSSFDISGIPSIFSQDTIDNLTIDVIDSYEKFKALFRLRHDIFHKFICDERRIPFGEQSINEICPELSKHTNYDYIKKQSPDIVVRNGLEVRICEIAVSRSSLTYQRKLSKYYILVDALRSVGFDVDIEIIILPLLMNFEDTLTFARTHNLDHDRLKSIISKIYSIEQLILQAEEKQPNWRLMMEERSTMEPQVEITDEELFLLFEEEQRKPFNSMDDLRNVLNSNDDDVLNVEDSNILDLIVDHALGDESLELLKTNGVSINEFWKLHNDMATFEMETKSKTHISVFPLPFFTIDQVNEPRDTSMDQIKIANLKKRLIKVNDAYLSSIGEMNIRVSTREKNSFEKKGLSREENECIGKPRISSELSREIAIEGPGRKHLIKGPNPSVEHLKAQRSKSLYYTGSELNTDELEEVLSFLSIKSEIKTEDIEPFSLNGPVWGYLKFTQSLYQEINLNFLRKELRKNHIIKPTCHQGVYIVLHKGPPFLTGAKNSLLWFKLIVESDDYKKMPHITKTWPFKALRPIGENLMMSSWQSTDPHRLSHYIRCYDRVLMTYLSYLQSSYNSLNEDLTTLKTLYHADTSDALGLITAVFLEDKRCTSKMLQDVRYVVMSSLSIRRYWRDLLDKFSEPIRSPLQLLLLRRVIDFISKMHNITLSQIYKLSKFGKSDPDLLTNYYKFAGSQILLPRVITKSKDRTKITFQQILSEMYFTMLFNKDQDDATHASFQVLEKILKGESNLEEVKRVSNLYTGFHENDVADIIQLMKNPKQSHVFSRRAIQIASKLQSQHKRNSARGKAAYVRAGAHPMVDKTLDEFATFKSSATFENDVYTDKITGFMQNKRRRCLDGVSDLLSKGHFKSSHVFNATKREDTGFQVFKKNQIGGVREILILSIATRIKINILESYCRVICSLDDREMLTHGDDKNKIFTNIQKELKMDNDVTGIIHHNYDKKRWGPSFMPIQFIYMFTPFKKVLGKYFNVFIWLLIKHTNKKCYYPDHLISAWINHQDKIHTRDPLLTQKKKEFLKNKKLYFINESNMGQGILHYTSSLFHLCVVSFREEIYNRMCKKIGIAPCKLIDLVSSDDSYTAQAFTKDSQMSTHIKLFLKAQSVTERLMNVETSKSKSSISPIIGEFNSLFISNLTTYPTLIKFSLASVNTFGTDSFSQLVKESHNSMRSLVENGGTLELYDIAQKLNSRYCEMIYHTFHGGVNDPSILFGVERSLIPYQFGVYPMITPLESLVLGPESHNLKIYNEIKKETCPEEIKSLLSSVHSVTVSDNVDLIANYSDTTALVGDINLVTVTRVDRRLKRMRLKSRVSKTQIAEHFEKDPLLIIRRPDNLEEVDIKTHLKMFQNSAIEAMKVSAGSLYFGRLGASYSVKCFSVRGVDDLLSYKEAMIKLSEIKKEIPKELEFFFERTIPLLESINIIQSSLVDNSTRNNLEIRSYHTLNLSGFIAKLSNPINRILSCLWIPDSGVEVNNSIMRDWIILQSRIPFLKNTMDQTLLELSDDKKESLSKLVLILMRLQGYSQSKMKAFIFGSGSNDPIVSADILYKQNKYIGLTSETIMDAELTDITNDELTRMFNLYNEFFLRHWMKLNVGQISKYINMDVIESYCSSKSCPESHKKRFLIMIMFFNMSYNIQSWTKKTGMIIPYWVRPQRKNRMTGEWEGPFELMTFYSDSVAVLIGDGYTKPELRLSPSTDDKVNGILVKETLKVYTNLEEIDNIHIFNTLGEGSFRLIRGKLVNSPSENIGFKLVFSDFPRYTPIAHKIIHQEQYSDLVDRHGSKIFRIQNGLFQIDRPKFYDGYVDFEINHVSYKKMVEYGILKTSFSSGQLTESQMMDLITTPKLNKQLLSNEMIDKYKDVDVDEQLFEIETNAFEEKDSNSENSMSELTLDAPEEFMANFSFDPNDFSVDQINQIKTWTEEEITADDYNLDGLFDASNNILDIFSVQKRILRQTPVIWMRVIWLKPMLISRFWLGSPIVNNYSILKAIQMRLNPEIIVSFMMIYQLLRSVNKDAESPRNMFIRADPDYYKMIQRSRQSWMSYLTDD